MAKTGRPKGSGSRYTVALGEAICAELAEGKPLRQICREREIAWRTVYDWRDAHAAFAALFARAREQGEDAIAAECIDIADETALDTITDKDGNERPNTEWISRSKLRIETRLKLLAKWNPLKWGDRLQQDINVKRATLDMSLDEILAELAQMGASTGGSGDQTRPDKPGSVH